MGSQTELTLVSINEIVIGLDNARKNAQLLLAPIIEQFDHAAAMARALNDFHVHMQRNAKEWLARQQMFIDGWMTQQQLNWAHMAEMIQIAAANFERYRNEEAPEACVLFSEAGWVGMDHHFSIDALRSSVLLHKTEGQAAMNEAIHDYFNTDDFAELSRIVTGWTRIPYLLDRRQIIEDAFFAHKNGLYTLSIPALLPLVEGLAAEVLGSGTMKAVVVLAEDRKANDPEIWVQGFCDFVARICYKNYRFGIDTPTYLNRHAILHGRVANYADSHNSTRVFLLIDAVAELWQEKQKALMPTTIQ